MKELFVTIFICLMISLLGYTFYNSGYKDALEITPSAMDVYQGKTTLQYTIVNDIKIDSIVIYKNKGKQ